MLCIVQGAHSTYVTIFNVFYVLFNIEYIIVSSGKVTLICVFIKRESIRSYHAVIL